MHTYWRTVHQALRDGQRVFLALVVDNTRHSPGTRGARMLVREDGTVVGTIGGGVMEFSLVERARNLVRQDAPLAERHTLYHRPSGPGERSGMICAGSQTNVYYLCRPEADREVVEAFLQTAETDEDAALQMGPAGMTLCRPSGLPAGQPGRFRVEGEDWSYLERLFNPRRLAVLGGGHCGLALSRQMHHLGYDVFLFDTRPGLETLERNTWAKEIRCLDDYRAAGALIAHPESTPVVVMTTNVTSDVRALLGVVEGPFPFVGVMGSPAKIARILSSLEAEGVPAALRQRIHAPVGLPIGSNTPEEIAVSIAAQLIQMRTSASQAGG